MALGIVLAVVVGVGAIRLYGRTGTGLSAGPGADSSHAWTETEVRLLRSLSLETLGDPPDDPSNAFEDAPGARALGHALFFDMGLGSADAVSCATCHRPDLLFTDGLPRSLGLGETPRHAPSLVGSGYQRWLFWDGRKDSLWSQALGPLENKLEHGGDRLGLARHVLGNHGEAYARVFGPSPDLDPNLPAKAGPDGDAMARRAWADMSDEDRDRVNRVFANIGKAIAAYVRTLRPAPAPFDAYVAAIVAGDQAAMESSLTPEQVAGIRVFIGSGRCTQCHNGPLLSNGDFHNIGVPPLPPGGTHVDASQVSNFDVPGADPGRARGVFLALDDPFNCLGDYSDAAPEHCAELRFAKTDPHTLGGAFKTPTLRNVADTAPYMHDGSLTTLRDVILHYNAAEPAQVGHSEITPAELTEAEAVQLEAFLSSLSGGVDVDAQWLRAPAGPDGAADGP